MDTYSIHVSRPAPSMNKDKYIITANSFKEAVEQMVEFWRAFQRFTTLHHGEYGVHCWYMIHANGETKNRNGGFDDSFVANLLD